MTETKVSSSSSPSFKEKKSSKTRKEQKNYSSAFPPEPEEPSPEEQHIFSASESAAIDHQQAFEQHQLEIQNQQQITLEQAAAIHAQQINDQLSQHQQLLHLQMAQDFPYKQYYLPNPPAPILIDPGKPYRCDYQGCEGKCYKKLNGLISHHYGFHDQVDLKNPKPYRCGAPGCEKQYRNTNGLAYHLENSHSFVDEVGTREPGTFFPSVHNTSPPPSIAGLESGAAQSQESEACELTAEELALGNIDPFPCYLCDKKFGSGNGLSIHLSQAHPAVGFPLISGLDEKLAFKVHNMDDVANTEAVEGEEGGMSYKCALCLTDFNDYKTLMNHMTEAHEAIGGIEYVGEV